jgi:hypothetical protein
MKERHVNPRRQGAVDEAQNRRPSPGTMIEPPPKETGPEPLYRVVYVIDVNAMNPREAAERAYEIMQDSQSMRPVLDIIDSIGHKARVDLSRD